MFYLSFFDLCAVALVRSLAHHTGADANAVAAAAAHIDSRTITFPFLFVLVVRYFVFC